MPAFPLLWPAIAMAALSFAVAGVLLHRRVRHVRANPPGEGDLTGTGARRYFEPADLPAHNLQNLFEMPVLFFVIVILLLLTELANDLYVLLAWAYVVLRAGHSWFHLRGSFRPRFLAFLLSMAVLAAMWIGFAADVVAAARAYSETMQTLEAVPLP